MKSCHWVPLFVCVVLAGAARAGLQGTIRLPPPRPGPGGVLDTLMPADRKLTWSLANPYGIAIDPAKDAWHAGRVLDAVVNRGGGVLVACETGGVWVVHENGSAYNVSRTWDNPDVECLALGPDGENHVYAGCNARIIPGGSTEVLWETDTTRPAPLLSPWKSLPVPAEVGGIHQIAVQRAARRIILASEGGLYWSPIPRPGGDYAWQKATGAPDGPFYGVAPGPKGTIIASAGSSVDSRGPFGIYTGKWELERLRSSSLVLEAADLKGRDPATVGLTSVAACRDKPENVYALCMPNPGTPSAVLRSRDGGKTWTACGTTLDYPKNDQGAKAITNGKLAGTFSAGGRVHRITVSPVDPELVGFGLLWAFISTDGGANWKNLGGWDWTQHPELHSDVHSLCFDPTDPAGRRILICADGGLVGTPDLGGTFTGKYNEKLANLQWYSTFVTRNFYGRFDVSPQVPGLVGGGLQDNGNVYAIASPPEPWRRLDGGDGGAGMFLPTGRFLRANMNSSTMWSGGWDAGKREITGRTTVPFRDRRTGATWDGLQGLQCDNVVNPRFKNAAGQLMYTVAGLRGKIYGLFANPDGGAEHWELVAAWPAPNDQFVGAIASATGEVIFAAIGGSLRTGPKGVQVVRITPSVGEMRDFTLGDVRFLPDLPADVRPPAGTETQPYLINRLVAESDQKLYALFNSYSTGKGSVLRTENGGESWTKLRGLPDTAFYALETDPTTTPPTVFVATDNRIYVSRSQGRSWAAATQGLPERPHCADLSFVRNADGTKFLYLSTYGWSVWRTAIE